MTNTVKQDAPDMMQLPENTLALDFKRNGPLDNCIISGAVSLHS